MSTFASRSLTACMAFGLALTPVAATAKASARLNDLVGAKAAGAETDLQNRGFVQTGGNKSGSTAYGFWWDADGEACVMVSTRDGRVASIDDRNPRECGRDGGSGAGGYNSGYPNNNQYGYDNAGPPPKVVLNKNGTASATLPGCLANFDRNGRKTSSFSSCKPEDLRRMTDAVAATRREQGLDSGNGGYGGGYGSGSSYNTPTPKLKQRSNGTLEVTVGKCRGYYTPDGRRANATSACEPTLMRAADDAAARFWSERGGYQNNGNNGSYNSGGYNSGSSGPARYSDLVGAKAAGADNELQSRGFRNVDGFESGNNAKVTIWWNGRTRQCLQMITANGRADSIEDIQTHQYCR